MFRSFRKVTRSLERSFEAAFSAPSDLLTAFTNTTISFGSIKVRLGNVIAEGGFSFIHVATPLSSSDATRRYAVKRLVCRDAETKRLAAHEINFLNSLSPHPNIVTFHGATYLDDHAFLLFDLIDGGTLPERLTRKSRNPNREPNELLSIFADIVAAVAHLHSMQPPVALRDVKLENVLYDRLVGCYKLCDFGSVTTHVGRPSSREEVLAAEEDISQNCTTMYCAPELVDLYLGNFICEKVDVWALGCVWYGMLFGHLPFDGSSSLAISNGLRDIPESPAYPPSFLQILRSCLTVDPTDRPDSFAVLTAIRHLQNRPLESEYSIAAGRLRAIRNIDYGRPPSPVEIEVTAEGVINSQVATNNKILIESGPSPSREFNRAPQSQHNSENDWADFTSAFGSQPALGTTQASNSIEPFSTVSFTKHQPSTQNSPSPMLSSYTPHAHLSKSALSQPAKNEPLIDFSDMECSTSESHIQALKSAKETDLIDFFTSDSSGR